VPAPGAARRRGGIADRIAGVSVLVSPPELHRLSIEEYHRLVQCGGFDEEARVELIEGLILDMSPKTPAHENAVRWLMEWITDHVDRSRHQLMVCGALTIGSSEPEPDLAIVERSEPRLEHPTGALLVIEVALSSSERDLGVKPALYARAVEEYWVVDLQARRVVVHRDGAEGAYREVGVVVAGNDVSARSVNVGQLPTGDLFATAFAEGRGQPA
jgi:Uma2 family endonuclease